ncbi:MAG: hypothetical protein M1814_006261 [Vezdaea aestivalis]|nr:MAG: hypothetical protein M1814_006261 [Vezdaea aestivalis]
MVLRGKSGTGYIVLNALRGLNIIALLLVVVASGIMMFKTSKKAGFFVFDQFSHVATSGVALFLVVSEVDFWDSLRKYFAKNWPLLGLSSGFSTLGLAMVILGCSTLGNLTKDWLSRDKLGPGLWTPIAVAGIVAMTAGLLSIALSLIFADRTNSISAREIRVYGATASSKDHLPKYSSSLRSAPSQYSAASRNSTNRRSMTRPNSSGLPPYHATSPQHRNISLPIPHTATPVPGPFPMSRDEVNEYIRKSPSGPGGGVGGAAVRGSTHVERPLSSYHPSRHAGL